MAEQKPKRRTREKILELSHRLFNDFGEPNVTTSMIGDEMNISPGNLYYHFRNKDEIVNALFVDFEREMDALLASPARRPISVEDAWLFLHLVFELIWKYRFIYRDLNDLLSRNRIVETHFRRILEDSFRVARQLALGMRESGELAASDAEIAALSGNMVLIATYWLSFEYVRNPRKPIDGQSMGRGVYHAMSMVAPYLAGDAKRLFERLAGAYLAQ
ncbi:MAG: TetR/AcrR family transcriptional regulator [Burkholderiales bacterium]|nr:TetR/AcrR family transcriptional regulator [Burkholderiales bacterium]